MSEQDPDDPQKPGGVKHDSRGNAVWQWAADTGRHAIDSTSRLLKRLDVPGLKIDEDDRPAKAPPPLHKPGLVVAPDERDRRPRAPDPGGGYDPYGGMGARVVKRPSQAAKQAASKPAAAGPGAAPAVRTPAAAPAPRPTLWQRLTGKR
jgi:hypothetical protein